LETSRNHHSSEIINDKSTAQQELRDLGVLTPEGKTIYSEQQAEYYFRELKAKGYESVTIKLKRAASGMGVFKINTLDELEKKLYEHRNELNDGLLMDGWIRGKFITSPNIQFNVGKTPEEDVFIGCSSQILSPDGTVHLGNISDMGIMENKRLVADLLVIRNWIRSKKAYGISGIDFSIFEDENGEQKAYFMEINGRINGSTHGAIIANKIFGDEQYLDKWSVVNNVMLKEGTTIDQFIQRLQRDKIYFDPSTKTGVLPTNISAIDKYSKAMVVIFGEKSKIMEMINILNSY
ncbi:ATP-grasp domain-containing protein, partial [Candidatus Gracilibacteria bacterium]|nr:ATP-grasp domain-containing protein [Candidatus Gracilibacteria bacterium]